MNRNNAVYKKLIAEHGSISHAARKFGLTRKTIYNFIEAGKIPARAKNKIINSGHDPENFTPICFAGLDYKYAKKDT